MAEQNPPRYLDSTAVAARLHIGVRTVYDYHCTGRLPEPDAVFGGSPVWLPETIDAYVESLPARANVHRTRIRPRKAAAS